MTEIWKVKQRRTKAAYKIMKEEERNKRNLKPHKAAIVAMALYNEKYAIHGLGSMDFWDALSDGQKATCRRIVANIEQAPKESEVK